ncbi:hypothetical protein DSL64_03905 [Dyadobacter luteus]|uniref:Transposase IS116/IS110/IS902 C-terminal domain-containing protein n=1 Tax=Dyadobacter luteus TaxID=2259619 RepID=A0A3D8YG02_9BACT|nr:transposase [Dyadobacter luteus]REA63597.1 hypothetical protein DSL64_03905 [Dyadobacter luteus]
MSNILSESIVFKNNINLAPEAPVYLVFGNLASIPFFINLATTTGSDAFFAFNTRKYLKGILGTDVYGISSTVALEVLGETGTDLSKWATEEKFVSWLNLCPNRKVSGGKLISSKLLSKKANLASQAFRMAANSLLSSSNWLGDYFRRMRSKGGHKYAIVATARKIAIIYYRMVRYK